MPFCAPLWNLFFGRDQQTCDTDNDSKPRGLTKEEKLAEKRREEIERLREILRKRRELLEEVVEVPLKGNAAVEGYQIRIVAQPSQEEERCSQIKEKEERVRAKAAGKVCDQKKHDQKPKRTAESKNRKSDVGKEGCHEKKGCPYVKGRPTDKSHGKCSDKEKSPEAIHKFEKHHKRDVGEHGGESEQDRAHGQRIKSIDDERKGNEKSNSLSSKKRSIEAEETDSADREVSPRRHSGAHKKQSHGEDSTDSWAEDDPQADPSEGEEEEEHDGRNSKDETLLKNGGHTGKHPRETVKWAEEEQLEIYDDDDENDEAHKNSIENQKSKGKK